MHVSGSMRGVTGESVLLYSDDKQWRCIEGGASIARLKEELVVPADFRQKARAVVRPGTTMVVTSEPGSTSD